MGAVVPQGDGGSPLRQAGGEVLRAVDGIHHRRPAREVRMHLLAVLLAHEGQPGQLFGEVGLQAVLHQEIRLGDRSVIGLDGHLGPQLIQLRQQPDDEVVGAEQHRSPSLLHSRHQCPLIIRSADGIHTLRIEGYLEAHRVPHSVQGSSPPRRFSPHILIHQGLLQSAVADGPRVCRSSHRARKMSAG